MKLAPHKGVCLFAPEYFKIFITRIDQWLPSTYVAYCWPRYINSWSVDDNLTRATWLVRSLHSAWALTALRKWVGLSQAKLPCLLWAWLRIFLLSSFNITLKFLIRALQFQLQLVRGHVLDKIVLNDHTKLKLTKMFPCKRGEMVCSMASPTLTIALTNIRLRLWP